MGRQGPSSFGRLLRRLRIAAGFSREALAERAGLSAKTVAALENGARGSPYRGTVLALTQALDLRGKSRSSFAAAASRPYRARKMGRFSTPRHNLPAPISSFVGREDVIAEVGALISRHRLVTLTATGGMGKTRVALRVAEQLASNWAGGVWFVDLGSVEDPSLVGERVAATLGVGREADARPICERLAAELRGQQLLLLLDNCEHVLAEAARVVATVLPACPRVSILATSRERLNVPGEHAYRVPPLALPQSAAPDLTQTFDSTRLFVERASAVASFTLNETTAPIVADICRRLDGIPLAIELAAAQVGDLTVHDLARHLDDRFRILGGGARSGIGRQQTMRAAIDWSAGGLPPAQQALLRRVAIFAGGWTLDAAATVCGGESEARFDMLEGLSALVRKSLVIADTGRVRTRYRLLETTQHYARERLDAVGERRSMSERHARWFARFCDEAKDTVWTTQFAPWLAGVGEELDNVRMALAWALGDDGNTAIALRLATGFAPFWRFVGLGYEGQRWLEAGLAQKHELVEPGLLASAWRYLAWFLNGANALEAAQRAVDLDEQGGDRFAQAQSQGARAISLFQTGRVAEAESDVDHSELLLRELDRLGTIAHAHLLGIRAVLLKEQGRFDDARRALEMALSVYIDVGDELRAAIVQGNFAELAFSAGEYQRAEELARAALLAWSLVGSPAVLPTVRINQAAYRLALGDVSGARDAARDVLTGSRRGLPAGSLDAALQHLAAVAALNGDSRIGALLIGYVNSRNRGRGYEREVTERHAYDIVMRALTAALPIEVRNELIAEGALIDEDSALELALAIG